MKKVPIIQAKNDKMHQKQVEEAEKQFELEKNNIKENNIIQVNLNNIEHKDENKYKKLAKKIKFIIIQITKKFKSLCKKLCQQI